MTNPNPYLTRSLPVPGFENPQLFRHSYPSNLYNLYFCKSYINREKQLIRTSLKSQFYGLVRVRG